MGYVRILDFIMCDKSSSTPPAPIGAQIRRLRQDQGLTLSELAQAARTSVPAMHRYESGWDRFELGTLRRIAVALGASLEVRLSPPPTHPPPGKPERKDVLALIAPLFWDRVLEDSDLEVHRDWVLARVLMFGAEEQVRAARRYFGDEAIRKATGRREVDARTRNYWELMLEGECTPKS